MSEPYILLFLNTGIVICIVKRNNMFWVISDAWCSSDHNKNYVFFEVHLPDLALVTGLSIQGGKDILLKRNDYWTEK